MDKSIEVLDWSENLVTGIPEIDEQHKRLVYLVNVLATNVANQPDINYLNYIFTELAEYAMYHFQTEENVWHEFLAHDPWETRHRMEHKRFVSIMIRLEDVENSKPLGAVLEDILSFLTHWLKSHILESDKQLAKVVLAVQSGMSLEQAKLLAESDKSKPGA